MKLHKTRLLSAMASGATIAYFADPISGDERRRRTAELLKDLVAPAPRHESVDSGPRAPGWTPGPEATEPNLRTLAVGEPTGTDTATGTDRSAKYTEPGYQDVSFGQATSWDAALAESLVAEEGGDLAAAEDRFEHEATGAPVLSRQRGR